MCGNTNRHLNKLKNTHCIVSNVVSVTFITCSMGTEAEDDCRRRDTKEEQTMQGPGGRVMWGKRRSGDTLLILKLNELRGCIFITVSPRFHLLCKAKWGSFFLFTTQTVICVIFELRWKSLSIHYFPSRALFNLVSVYLSLFSLHPAPIKSERHRLPRLPVISKTHSPSTSPSRTWTKQVHW